MGNVVLLDDLTINKIAAGEVIERPASVVKEMIENSIDAGATAIQVEIKNGGISYIRVTDNGKGILTEDMEISFERHATSKIRSAQDLETVTSMGFRGEALASIAAISHVELLTKTKEDITGHRIVVEGGKVIETGDAGCPIGTTITVTNLFYNTPVRYKFLKKDFTESGYIEDAVMRLALVNPKVSFKLIQAGKTIIQTTGDGDIKNTIYSIFGKEIAQNILPVNYTYEDIKVEGVVGKPNIARSNRSHQLFFVNKRYVKDKTLSGASEKAFKGLLTIGKYGFIILNMTMDPKKVDVNVHPAKLEVRFEEENKVFKAVYHAIQETLLKNDLVSNPEKEEYEQQDAKTIEEVSMPKEKQGFRNLWKREENPFDKSYTPNRMEQLYQEKRQSTTSSLSQSPEIMTKILEMQKRIEQEVQENPDIKLKNRFYTTDHSEEQETKKINLSEIKKLDEEAEKEPIPQEIQNFSEKVIPPYMQTIGENSEQESNSENIVGKPVTNLDMQEIITKLKNGEMMAGQGQESFEEMYVRIFGKLPPSQKQETEESIQESVLETASLDEGKNISVFEEQEVYQVPTYQLIGIAFKTYIMVEMEEELYMIDQHAAHERIMYERIKENYDNNGPKDSQLMLLPDIITLSHKEMGIAKDNWDMFEKAGFVLEEFGENTIKLTGVPNVCIDLDTKDLFLETLDEINTVARTAKQEIEEKFIATVACKAAVKANMALTVEEVDNLMKDLLKLPNPFTCPHGRPTAIKMTKTEIEKKFSRR